MPEACLEKIVFLTMVRYLGLLFVCLFFVHTPLVAVESTKNLECSVGDIKGNHDYNYFEIFQVDTMVKSRISLKESCTVNISRLKKAGVLDDWDVIDLRERQNFQIDHLAGARHGYVGAVRFDQPQIKTLYYLPDYYVSFDKLCLQISNLDMKHARIISNSKPSLLQEGFEYISDNELRRSLAYITSDEFIPNMVAKRWTVFDLTTIDESIGENLMRYDIDYQVVDITKADIRRVVKKKIRLTQGNTAFLVNKEIMRKIKKESSLIYKKAWYVDVSESTLTDVLERHQTILNYKRTPNKLPKCYHG